MVKGEENAAQGADDCRVLPLGFQQRCQLLIGFPLLTLRFQLPDFPLMDGLGRKKHMTQTPLFIPVTFDEGALGPAWLPALLRAKLHRTQILPGNNPAVSQPFLQCR